MFHFNLFKAHDRFRAAIARVARESGFDLVIDKSAVRLKPTLHSVYLADITAAVVQELGRR